MEKKETKEQRKVLVDEICSKVVTGQAEDYFLFLDTNSYLTNTTFRNSKTLLSFGFAALLPAATSACSC